MTLTLFNELPNLVWFVLEYRPRPIVEAIAEAATPKPTKAAARKWI
jgi:hypothetical protein